MVDAELVARVFRVLGERSRLAILELLLADGELHQAQLIRRLGLSQARLGAPVVPLLVRARRDTR